MDAARYRRRRTRRSRLAGAVATASVVVVALTVIVVTGSDDETVAVPTTTTIPDTTTVTVPSVPPLEPVDPGGEPVSILGAGWEELDPGPIAGRHRMATAWTGSELFVWGGHYGSAVVDPPPPQLFLQDGYVFRPTDGVWTPTAPLPDGVCHLGDPRVVVVGDAIVLWGRGAVVDGCTRAVAYSLDDGTWESLHGEFFSRLGSRVSVVWTGDMLVAPLVGLAYDWDSRETFDLPAFPAGPDDTVHSPQRAYWTGDRVLAIGSGSLRSWAPGDGSWSLLDGPPVPDRARDSVWTDQGLLVANYQMAAAFYRNGVWTRPGDLPLRFFECLPEARSVGGTPVVRMCSGIAIWDGVRGSWVPVALDDVGNPSWGPLVASDDSLYVMGPNFRRFTIDRNPDGSIVVPPTIPIGVMQLDIPDGFEFVSSFAPEQGPEGFIPDDETIGVVFESLQGARCTVTSTHGPGEGWPAGFTEGREGVQVWGRPVVEYIDADGTVGMALHDPNGSDVAFVWCVGLSVADYRPAIDFIAGLWSPWEEPVRWMAHDAHGLRFEIPEGWVLAGESLTPNLAIPTEVFSAATYPMRPGGNRCAHVPEFGIEALGPTDAFVSVQWGPTRYAQEPRPDTFTFDWLTPAGVNDDVRECLSRTDRYSLDIWWSSFLDGGRALLVIIALGDDASDQTRSEVLRILDSMEWVGES
jgi:hypothetical protein